MLARIGKNILNFDNEISRMKNKGEFCIWKRMKYEKVVAKSNRSLVSQLCSGTVLSPDTTYLGCFRDFPSSSRSERMHTIPMRLIDFEVNLNYC